MSEEKKLEKNEEKEEKTIKSPRKKTGKSDKSVEKKTTKKEKKEDKKEEIKEAKTEKKVNKEKTAKVEDDKTKEKKEKAEDKKKEEEAKAALEAEKKDNYNKVMQSLTYDINTAPIKIDEADCISLIKENNLPSLSRMSEEDTKKYMSELQVLKKIEKLGIDPAQFETPELNWKNTYNTEWLK